VTISIDHIDACLPQTQCTQCGYPCCRAYAEAMARGEADINRCPPGDSATILALAQRLGVDAKPLDTDYGQHRPRTRAVIDEAVCIGCRKCIDACPVDAIVGARKFMHSVIQQACSGCELCLAPCPVDCIIMVPSTVAGDASLWPEYTRAETERWRQRAQARLARLERRRQRNAARSTPPVPPGSTDERLRRKAEIRAAVERVKQKRTGEGKR
jgi:electron transport complex protein RnfB